MHERAKNAESVGGQGPKHGDFWSPWPHDLGEVDPKTRIVLASGAVGCWPGNEFFR